MAFLKKKLLISSKICHIIRYPMFYSGSMEIGLILSLATILKMNREKLHARLGTESFAKLVS